MPETAKPSDHSALGLRFKLAKKRMLRSKLVKKRIRKKPCPYCGKKLQAKSKGQWRNNLARHLANACPPYERETISMGTRMIWELLRRWPELFPFAQLTPIEKPAAPEELAELERIVKLEPPANG